MASFNGWTRPTHLQSAYPYTEKSSPPLTSCNLHLGSNYASHMRPRAQPGVSSPYLPTTVGALDFIHVVQTLGKLEVAQLLTASFPTVPLETSDRLCDDELF